MKNNSQFNEFVASLESFGFTVATENLNKQDRVVVENTYGKVKDFLMTNNLVQHGDVSSMESFDSAIRTFNGAVNLTDLGPAAISELCQNCGIKDRHLRSAVESVALCINQYQHGYEMAKHFDSKAPSAGHGNFEVRTLGSMFGQGLAGNLASTPRAALESFGSDMRNVISDAKAAITVSILRYHRSVLHRMIPNIATDQAMVTFKVDHAEVYDLTKSRDQSSSTRYEDQHRVPFIDLYRDPSPANTSLKPFVLRTANDAAAPNNKLLAENIVKMNTGLNMLDYSLDANQLGYQHVDFTDIVADNVRVKGLYLSVTDGTITEMLKINTYDLGTSRLMMNANNRESSERSAVMNEVTSLDNTATIVSGAGSALLGGLSDDAVLRFKLHVTSSISLRSSDVHTHGTIEVSLVTKSGNVPIAADVTLFNALVTTLAGYEMHAEFSEENIRKSTKAMRMLTKQVGYEIPASANYLVDYSLVQTRPESVIDGLTKLMSIGIDDRGIKLIVDTMKNVYDRVKSEANLTADNYQYKVSQDFVAGQKVRPYIYMDTMTVDANTISMRTGDRLGDLRAYAEMYLLNTLSRIFSQSFLHKELGAGEKPQFTVLTSGPIKDSLLSVPHYHNHLTDTAADRSDDGVVEFRRTLSNGVILNVVTTTFADMIDKMIIIPVRPNDPNSEINFAQNYEVGTFIAQATPTIGDAIFNRLVGNTRSLPLVTNPVGAIIQVSNLNLIFSELGSLGAV